MIETEKLDGASLDIAAEKRSELLRLFPEAAAEGGRVDIERLRLALGDSIETGKERYGLSWPGKADCFKTIQSPSMATLLPAPDKSVNFETTENLIIEGDNLEVLKLLQKSYLGKIKMIYIDPPYNTGNDFIYPDDYSESLQTYLQYTGQVDADGRKFGTNADTDGRFHSKWLNMMYPRLYLARNLLRDDGLMFASIDDHEYANLRKICDEIFGEENFVGSFAINSTPNARDYGQVAKMHEYALLYCKNSELVQTNMLPTEDKTFRFKDNIGEFNVHPLYNSNTAFHAGNRPNLYYPFYLDQSGAVDGPFYKISLQKAPKSIEIFPPKSQKEGVQFVWRWGRTLAESQLNKEIIGYKTEGGDFRIVQKMRHNAKIIRSLLLETAYSSRRGTAEVEELLGQKVFYFPKPVELIKAFCQVATASDDIVLDFFAGSGTTAHAVLEINDQDNGRRSFILVQLPEKTESDEYQTLADICRERVRRVVKRLAERGGALQLDAERNKGLGFRVLKLAQSNVKEWDAEIQHDAAALEEQLALGVDHLRQGRSDTDILYEVILKSGYPLSVKVNAETIEGKTVYSVSEGAFLISLERSLTLDLVRSIGDRRPERVLLLDEGFAGNDQLKTNAVQAFKAKDIVFRTL